MMKDFLTEAQEATAALRELFEATPLQRNDLLSDRYGAEIWLKREDLTPVRFDQSQADGDARMTVRREGDLFHIRIGGQRFEIPEAVITGG